MIIATAQKGTDDLEKNSGRRLCQGCDENGGELSCPGTI